MLDKRFKPQKIEGKIYSFWEKNGFFKPDLKKKKKPFCILMPPPNANGPLHIGHAVFVTIQDILTRFHRMRQEPTLWLPGFDHAGFETWVVFEKKQKKDLSKTKKSLYREILRFTKENIKTCREQLKKLGASCDWSREKFTLDEDIVKIVCQTFKKLFSDGLVYRGERIINWCVKHQTSLSDLETTHQEVKGKLYYIRYPLKDEKGKYVVVATTRPETMLGDTALAFHPKDKRYKNLFGKKAIVPFVSREIPIIKDRAVDPEFGSGIVKVTPAHDPVDFEIGERHGLKKVEVIGKDGRMKGEIPSQFKGLKTKEARKKIIEELKKMGLLEKEEDYSYSVVVCYKCKTPIEFLISKQWFIKIEPLAKKAIEVVRKNKIKFHPSFYKKIFLNWMKDIRDWNISRQIIWGIQMPIWYCKKCQKEKRKYIIVATKKPKRCPRCKSRDLVQEKDVFDTWFSSGQWPFAALGYPRSKDFKTFYPTSVMETGWDILFFWVARMIMLSLYRTGEIPFENVVLHGLVRDKDRQKMSKSKGNVIDPLGVIEDFGADALRMALVFGTSTGRDIIISEEKIIGQRNFANKIWNAGRFVLMNLEKNFDPKKIKPKLTPEDKWILKELKSTFKKVTKALENFEFHIAAHEIYHFFWHKFCDKTIENCKKRIYQGEDKETPKWVLYVVLLNSLKLLHPFMPFVTEEIYQKLPAREKKALIIEEWKITL